MPRSLLALLLACQTADSAPTPEPFDPDAPVVVGPAFLAPLLPQTEPLREAMAVGDAPAAVAALKALDTGDLPRDRRGDHAFLLSWELMLDGRAGEAEPYLDLVRLAAHVPDDRRQLVLGEILLASGKPEQAAEALAAVPETSASWAKARAAAARALDAAGQPEKGTALWTALAARTDPVEGNPEALWALARSAGLKSKAAAPYLRRLWAHYPFSPEAQAGAAALKAHEARGARPTNADIAAHAEALMVAWQFEDVNTYLAPLQSRFKTPNPEACRVWYADGRSRYKRSHVTKAAEILKPAGERCVGIDDDRGAKALYLAGKSLERKKLWAQAAKVYARIPELYPAHTMADDGYTLAGIAASQAGDAATALARWTAQAEHYQENGYGDLAAEGLWRLAWHNYESGDTAAARRWTAVMISDGDAIIAAGSRPVHVMAARYWDARWRVFPDHARPTTPNPDAAERKAGLDDLLALCREHPWDFYALLASTILQEFAPEALTSIKRPASSGAPDTWTLTEGFIAEPAVRRGLAMARLGISTEAMRDLGTLEEDALGPSEDALVVSIYEQHAWHHAHARLRETLLRHLRSALGPDRDRILKMAYPDRFWPEVNQSAKEYAYDARIFHSLVREESSFNPLIVSHAGARGLSQVMPATAQTVAGWLGVRVSTDQLFHPPTNLMLGARYLEYLRRFFDDNFFLMVGAYNAGEGNVQKWGRLRGDRPTDEFIENIPLRETRGYVKRVLGTYQLMRVLYGEGPVFPDWRHTRKRAVKAR